jgi:hypothetical protein
MTLRPRDTIPPSERVQAIFVVIGLVVLALLARLPAG